jgi:hypothetical protein
MYNNMTGSTECILCLEGYYCPEEGMTKPVVCELDSYCPQGSVMPTACPDGTESNLVGSISEADCLEIIDPSNESEVITVVDLIEDQENGEFPEEYTTEEVAELAEEPAAEGEEAATEEEEP